ncbi:MAG: hypothetical protein WA277_10280 [Nitrospirota bacterium]
MITDAEIKIKGLEALINTLGEVEAERFISLIMREPFDYTKWQRTLWADKSVTKLSVAAMQHRKKTNASFTGCRKRASAVGNPCANTC